MKYNMGNKVLIIDIDPKGFQKYSLGIVRMYIDHTYYGIMVDGFIGKYFTYRREDQLKPVPEPNDIMKDLV